MANQPELYPTCDIHLLLDEPDVSMQAIIRDFNNYELRITSSVELTDFDSSIVSTGFSRGIITFSPVAFGETIGRVRHGEWEVLIRVRVHRSVKNIWLAHDAISIHQGEDNYIVSVYAQFDDNTVGDVTYHPFYQLSIPNSAQRKHLELISEHSDLLNNGLQGRLKGTKVSPDPILLRLAYKNIVDEINVYVEPPLTPDSRKILECVYGSSTVDPGDKNRRHILFLAEGFRADEKEDFYELIIRSWDKIVSQNIFLPFPLLKEAFSIWIGFDPTPESSAGVTIGSPMYAPNCEYIKSLGIEPDTSFTFEQLLELDKDLSNVVYTTTLPLRMEDLDVCAEDIEHGIDGAAGNIQFMGLPSPMTPYPTSGGEAETLWQQKVLVHNERPQFEDLSGCFYSNWINQYVEVDPAGKPNIVLPRTKNTRMGYIVDRRWGEKAFYKVDTDKEKPLNSWYPEDKRPDILWDYRRMTSEWWTENFNKYIRSLAINEHRHKPIPEFSERWLREEGDEKRGIDYDLVVVILNTGFSIGANGDGVSWVGLDEDDYKLRNTAPAGSIPNYAFEPGNIYDPPIGGVKILRNNLKLYNFCSVITHELGHSFNLLDEYEGNEENNHTLKKSEKDIVKEIDESANLISRWKLFPNQNMNIEKTKWAYWHRMQYSANVQSLSRSGTNRLQVQINSEDYEKLRKPSDYMVAKAGKLQFFLRTRNIIPGNGTKFFILGPFELVERKAPQSLLLSGATKDYYTGKTVSISSLQALNGRSSLVLYIPKYDKVNDKYELQKIFHLEAFELLKEKGQPFYEKPLVNGQKDCSPIGTSLPKVKDAEGEEIISIPQFANFSPTYHAYANGIYEGGGTRSCNVYRVSPGCKMRNHLTAVLSKLALKINREMQAGMEVINMEEREQIGRLLDEKKKTTDPERIAEIEKEMQEIVRDKLTNENLRTKEKYRVFRYRYYLAQDYIRYTPFCDACTYYLVNLIDPSSLQDVKVRALGK